MKQIPEIFTLVYETLVHSHRPSSSSKLEKAKPRSASLVRKPSFYDGTCLCLLKDNNEIIENQREKIIIIIIIENQLFDQYK